MSDYIDASVLVPLVVEQPTSDAADAFMASRAERWLVSQFAVAEASSALSRLVRMDELATRDALVALTDLDNWLGHSATVVEIEPDDVRVAQLFVRRFETKLRTPDALHLAVCRRLGARLVTFDRRLRDAAAMLGVASVNPDPAAPPAPP